MNEIQMDTAQRDPREMSDEETTMWMQELVDKLTEIKGSSSNACSLEAIKNPVRRSILRSLGQRALEISEISEIVGVRGMSLRYHLNLLVTSYFIRIEGNRVDLTPGGVAIIRSHGRRVSPKE